LTWATPGESDQIMCNESDAPNSNHNELNSTLQRYEKFDTFGSLLFTKGFHSGTSGAQHQKHKRSN